MRDASDSLCGHCRRIFSSRLHAKTYPLDWNTLSDNDLPFPHPAISILDRLQPKKCCVCALISIHHTNSTREGKFVDLDIDHLQISIQIQSGLYDSHVRLGFSMCYTIERISGALGGFEASFEFKMIPTNDDARLPELTANFPSATLNPLSIKFLQTKLSDCCRHHIQCNARAFVSKLRTPKRLLHIENAPLPMVRLIEYVHTPEDASYTTLSHCWGDVQPLRLTMATENELRSGISLDQLPRSFRDAVVVTQALSVFYIWIDSLCIFQDNLTDWETEAVAMRGVYANAICNIAATAAENSSVGLSCDRDPTVELPFSVETDWRREEGSGPLHDFQGFNWSPSGRYLVFTRAQWTDDLENGVLNQRGWVIQERLLCRRILHFTASQIFWECSEGVSSDIFPEIYPRQLISPNLFFLHHDAQAFKESFTSYLASSSDDTNPTSSEDNATQFEKHVVGPQVRRNHVLPMDELQFNTSWEDVVDRTDGKQVLNQFDLSRRNHALKWEELLYQGWQSLLMVYSGCRLSVERDKLVAIAAVSGILSEAFKDEFVAGFWRRYLIEELLWARDTYHESPQSPFPKHWRAPTWSWVRTNFQIRPLLLQTSYWGSHPQARAFVEHVDVDSYPSGQLKHASIRLRGKIFRAHTATRDEYGTCRLQSDSGLVKANGYFSIIYDDPNMKWCKQQGLICMALVDNLLRYNDSTISSTTYQIGGLGVLVLRSSPSQVGCYERIGISHVVGTEVSSYLEHEDTEEQSIRVI